MIKIKDLSTITCSDKLFQNHPNPSAGEHEITWQPKGLPGGIYFYRLHTGDPYIQSVLRSIRGKIYGPGGAVELLDIDANTLRNRMNKLGTVYGRKRKVKHS